MVIFLYCDPLSTFNLTFSPAIYDHDLDISGGGSVISTARIVDVDIFAPISASDFIFLLIGVGSGVCIGLDFENFPSLNFFF